MVKSNNIFFWALRNSNEYVNKRFKSMLLALLWIHEIKKRFKLFKNGMQNEVEKPTRFLQFVAFVHLPLFFRSRPFCSFTYVYHIHVQYCQLDSIGKKQKFYSTDLFYLANNEIFGRSDK